ncbi:MAG: hypothetical protein QOC71_312 [Thermoplasmata archaeon]|nr:hypothetical protein [Thermoplasmata archaeon]
MRQALVPVLLMVSLAALSGCFGGGKTDEAPPAATSTEPTPMARPTLVDPVRMTPVRLGEGAGEPNIAVAPDGTIYVTPIDHVYRSSDGGKSFEDLGTTRTNGHGDGDIAIDASGRIHWLGLFGDAGPIPYQQSDDRGKTFSKGFDVSAKDGKKDGTGSDREWIDVTPDGIVYTSWRDSDDGGIIGARTSFDGGLTWEDRVTMSPDAVGGPIVHGPKPGQVFEAMTTFSDSPAPGEGTGAAIKVARSFDNGTTWDLVDAVVPPQSVQFGLIGFPTSIFPVAAVDDAGTLYVVFSADQRALPAATPKPAARYGAYLIASTDLGAHWTEPTLLSNPDHAAVMPFAAAGAAGRIAVTWYESTVGLPSDNLPDLWNVNLWESVTADQASPEGRLVQLNEQPNHIGSVCTAGTGCLAGGDRSLLDYFEVAIQPNGHPVATWSYSVAGTAVGLAAQGTDIWVGGVASGTPLR